jgi:hypothetical protein
MIRVIDGVRGEHWSKPGGPGRSTILGDLGPKGRQILLRLYIAPPRDSGGALGFPSSVAVRTSGLIVDEEGYTRDPMRVAEDLPSAPEDSRPTLPSAA